MPKVEIYFTDGDGNRVKQFKDVSLNSGFYDNKWQPSVGEFDITVPLAQNTSWIRVQYEKVGKCDSLSSCTLVELRRSAIIPCKSRWPLLDELL